MCKMETFKNLTEGTFVKLTGMSVKNENDIFVVDCDYRIPGKYGVCHDERCLNKVKLNGEKKTGGYDIVFLNEHVIEKNSNVEIEIVTDLKKAKKEVKDYLNGVTSEETVVTYEISENQNIEKGSIIRFKKGLSFGMFGGKRIGKNSIFVVAGYEKTLWIQRLGKQGQVLSLTDPKNSFNFAERLYKKVIDEEYIEIVEKIETKKGDLTKEKINKNSNATQKNENVININEYKEENKEELNNMNMSILDKFENIEIENTDRISPEDKNYCEIHNETYNKTLEIYKQTLESLIKLYNEQLKILPNYKGVTGDSYSSNYIDKYGDCGINKIIDCIKKLQNSFISKICQYFKHKYNITIDIETIQKKYEIKEKSINLIREDNIEYTECTYNNILDEIFEQLGGFTFNEKAADETINNMKKICVHSYDNKNNAKVKGKKITIDSFFYLDYIDKKYGTDRVSYNSDENFNILLTALTHFEQGLTHNAYHNIYNNITNGENEKCITTHSLICMKAESLKLFKNGKIEITFLNSEYAKQFAKIYCGYVEQVA